jgi:hypothetical protein
MSGAIEMSDDDDGEKRTQSRRFPESAIQGSRESLENCSTGFKRRLIGDLRDEVVGEPDAW